MGQEMPAEWYDERFPESKSYQGPVQASPFHGVWMATMVEVIRALRAGGVLIDIGCGPGQLSEYAPPCYDYRGYDFSAVALEMARRERNPDCTFQLWDANTDPVPVGDVYVATEFLEHIEADLRVLRGIPKDSPVIASLPMRDSKGHVRFFETEESIRTRYGKLLRIDRVISLLPLNSFVLSGVRTGATQ